MNKDISKRFGSYFYIAMGLILKRDVAEESELGIWKIEEDADWFRSQLILNKGENTIIDSIKNPQRQLHWLSSRVLIRSFMNTKQFIHLENDLHGKPVIHNFPVHISLSHSADLSAILISKKFSVGIDIEKIDPKILRIKNKFLNDTEKKSISEEEELNQLYVIWCAKEAMYKLYGKKQLEFREHLFVSAFKYAHSGELNGRIEKDSYSLEVKIIYEKLEDYMMGYVISKRIF